MTEQMKKIVKKFGVEDISDVCLVVENAEFHVHKPVLACQSKVFKTMFYGDSKEKNEKRIEITDADPLAFQRILELVYNQEISDESFLLSRYSASSEAFWEQSTALWKLIDRFDMAACQKTFVKLLEKYCSKKVSSFLVARLPDEPKSLKAIDFMQKNNFSYRISTNSTLLNVLMSSSGAGDTHLAAEQLAKICEPVKVKVEDTSDVNDGQEPDVTVNSVENSLKVNAQLNEQSTSSGNDFWETVDDFSDDVVLYSDSTLENKENESMNGDLGNEQEEGDHEEVENEGVDSDEDHDEDENEDDDSGEEDEENWEDTASDDEEDDANFEKKGIQKKFQRVSDSVSSRLLYACPVKNCPFSYNIFSRLLEHAKTHTDKEDFFCDVCKTGFSSKNAATRHVQVRKKRECCACKKTFASCQTLLYHLRLHSGEKPFSCGYCKKRFSQMGSFKYHETTHTGERSFKCGYCSRSFTKKQGLSDHERRHTGERPYSCKKCSAKFISSSALYQHMKNKHMSMMKKP